MEMGILQYADIEFPPLDVSLDDGACGDAVMDE